MSTSEVNFEVVCGGRVFPFSGETMLVGRSAACDIHLTDHRVSRKHARLRLDAGGVVVEDLGSGNGVLVNGERIDGERRLEKGDRIHIGEHELQARVMSSERVMPIYDPVSFDEDDLELSVGAITVVDSQIAMVFEAAQTAVDAGNASAAEAVLGPGLRALHKVAFEGEPISTDDLIYCVRGACLLARSRSKVEWVKYAVDVQLAAKERVSDAAATLLEETARQLEATSELERLK